MVELWLPMYSGSCLDSLLPLWKTHILHSHSSMFCCLAIVLCLNEELWICSYKACFSGYMLLEQHPRSIWRNSSVDCNMKTFFSFWKRITIAFKKKKVLISDAYLSNLPFLCFTLLIFIQNSSWVGISKRWTYILILGFKYPQRSV